MRSAPQTEPTSVSGEAHAGCLYTLTILGCATEAGAQTTTEGQAADPREMRYWLGPRRSSAGSSSPSPLKGIFLDDKYREMGDWANGTNAISVVDANH